MPMMKFHELVYRQTSYAYLHQLFLDFKLTVCADHNLLVLFQRAGLNPSQPSQPSQPLLQSKARISTAPWTSDGTILFLLACDGRRDTTPCSGGLLCETCKEMGIPCVRSTPASRLVATELIFDLTSDTDKKELKYPRNTASARIMESIDGKTAKGLEPTKGMAGGAPLSLPRPFPSPILGGAGVFMGSSVTADGRAKAAADIEVAGGGTKAAASGAVAAASGAMAARSRKKVSHATGSKNAEEDPVAGTEDSIGAK